MAEGSVLKTEIKEFVLVKLEDGSYRGWKTELLVEKIAKSEEKLLLCKICQGLLREASLFENEGKQELRCSLCLPQNVPSQKQLINQESVNDKIVVCPLQSKGCEWSDVIIELISHLDECPFFPLQCPLGCVTEKGDGKREVSRFERRFLESHQKTNCPMRLISCESCNSPIKAYEMIEHIQTCEEYLMPCPNACVGEGGATQTKRKSVSSHLEECSLQEVSCPYAEYGCGSKMERRMLDQHDRDSMHTHFRITMLRMQEDNREQALKIASLEDAMTEKEREFNSIVFSIINPGSGSLEWKVTKVKNKIESKRSTESNSFYFGLYKFQCEIYWDRKSTGNVGVFLRIMKGNWDDKLTWPLRYKCSIILFNQIDETQNYAYSYEITQSQMENFPECFQKPVDIKNLSFGPPEFISHDAIQQEKYLKDDSLFLKIVVEFINILK